MDVFENEMYLNHKVFGQMLKNVSKKLFQKV